MKFHIEIHTGYIIIDNIVYVVANVFNHEDSSCEHCIFMKTKRHDICKFIRDVNKGTCPSGIGHFEKAQNGL